MSLKKINPIDEYIGKQMRAQRLACGMSQEVLAKKIGITFQQIQKYERGMNRISVSRLIDISLAMDVPFEYFVADYIKGKNLSAQKPQILADSKDAQKLLQTYKSISNTNIRKHVLSLICELANAAPTKKSGR